MDTQHDPAEGVSAADAGRRHQSGGVGDPNSRVERTCTQLQTDGPAGNPTGPRSLSDFRGVAALVLLGGPGAGKTNEFEAESEALGDVAMPVSARSFVTFDPPLPEWWNKTLFIDGLDEVRAGSADARPVLDQVRNRLRQLGFPPFRLSCREADWLGNNDLQALAEVSSDSRITVLRLDPLAPSAARELLNLRHPTVDAQKFMVEASRQGIHSMLTNPLTLTLLADAVAPSGAWPDNRRDIFQAACLQMAREHDRDRRGGVGLPDEALVEAAGFLCALLLLADVEAWSHGPGSDPRLCVSLDDLGSVAGDPSRSALRAALGTKLFTSPDGTGFVPLHRQVAEFLAGRHLAKRIDEGLPASRVVALTTSPSDGRVVTSLRGLSGWLAAYSPQARGQLIDDDPAGVALYGDISGFSIDDKKRLLRALDALPLQAPILDYEQPDSRGERYWADTAWAFRHLACAGMVGAITDLLNRGGAQLVDERLELLALGAVSKAVRSEIPNLACLLPVLEALVGGASQPAALRRSALDAYRHILPEDDRARVLLDLLDELDADADSDLDGELRGTLLGDLYPTAVTPTRVWDYACGPYQHHLWGRFRHFWTDALTECLSEEQFGELLDALSEDVSQLIPAVRRASGRAKLPVEILDRGLTMFGETIESTRLDRWLRIVGVYEWRSNSDSEPMRQIRAWLAAHPRAQRTVFLMRLRRRPAEESTRSWAWRLFDPVLKETMHANFGLWCFETAIEVADEEPTVSRTLLTHSFVSLENPLINDGLTLEVMRERTRRCPDLARELEELCQEQAAKESLPPDPQVQTGEEFWAEQRAEEEQGRAKRAQQIRSRETELRENRFSAAGLHELATEFLGVFSDSDPPAPRRRLADYLGGDEVAVDAALAGLRDAVRREDVPDVEETISLHLQGQQSWLAYPVLASLQLLDEEDPASLDILDDATKRRALAIHYCVPLGDPHPRVGRITWVGAPAGNDPPADDQPPAWQDRWFDKTPELVLDVLYRCAVAGIRHGMEHPPGLRDLDLVTDHDDAVQNIRLKLLKSFPPQGSDAQLFLLDSLAAGALNHPDWTTLRGRVRRKAELKSMTVGQRVRWLAIDAAISSPSRLGRLKEFVDGSRNRTRHLAEVLQHPVEHLRGTSDRPRSIRSILAGRQEPATLKALIEMLGPFFGPTDWGGYVTVEKAMSEYLIGLIGNLGSLAGNDTQETLEALIGNPHLASWHGFLKMARERQIVVHRDYSYQPKAIDQVQRTLGGGAPADAADLAALVSAHLADVGANIRGDNDNFWRHFWNENSYGQPTKPKPENSCRDALLTALRPLLPPGVRVEPEHRHAGESRADIEVICGEFSVPIEIKPSSHGDLVNGLHSQLIAKYTNAPAASGHGIYLILWLGAPISTPQATPGDLQQQLESTLTPDQAREISVIVIDVTKPDGNLPPSGGS